jgi:murein DD-endopeptidase MepM/ murein hydrolase activator NlpD
MFILIFLSLFLVHCSQFQGIFETAPATAQTSSHTRSSRAVKPLDLNKSARSENETLLGEARESIATKQGTYYFVKLGDTLARISGRYKISWDDIAEINHLYDSDLVVGRRLFLPNKKTISQYVEVSKVISEDRSRSGSSKKVDFTWPIETPRITSVFGHRRGRPHDGVDIGAQVGTPVLAAEDGRVIFSERFAGYGNLVVVKHAQDYFTAYAHNSDVYVKKGQRVKRGQKISLVGMTGRTTGPHLHFEIRHGQTARNPLFFLPDR